MKNDEGSSASKLGDCRICHEEDEDSNMEVPCSCRGTLKYAHRRCVQKWCNEKGDTVCEICRRILGPDYMAPPPSQFYQGGIPSNLREDWDNHQIPSAVFSSRISLDSEFDEYPVLNAKSLICCRIVAMIFCTLLLIRHSLTFIIYGTSEQISSSPLSLIMVIMLRAIAIVLPIYVMAKALTAALHMRSLQEPYIVTHATSSDEESELRPMFT